MPKKKDFVSHVLTDPDISKPELNDLSRWNNDFADSMDENAKHLYDSWMSCPDNLSIKVSTYFQAYSELLSKYRNKEVFLTEIGVLEGGSLMMWKKWLGQNSKIIGIDLNPKVKRFQSNGIDILIGDQANLDFWKYFYKKYPRVDIIIDDGGHQFFQQVITFFATMMFAKHEVMLIFEDVSTSFFKDFRLKNGEESFFDFIKDLTDNLTLKQVFSKRYNKKWISNIDNKIIKRYRAIRSISFYSGLVAIVIDPKSGHTPLYLKNSNTSIQTKDFRHKGNIDGVSFPWSDPQRKKTVKFVDPSAEGEIKLLKINS